MAKTKNWPPEPLPPDLEALRLRYDLELLDHLVGRSVVDEGHPPVEVRRLHRTHRTVRGTIRLLKRMEKEKP